MELSKVTQMIKQNPLPVIGIESDVKSKKKSKPEPSLVGNSCLVSERAYYKAEARGFEPGHELEDWLAAEAEVNQ
ncbi:MAG: DUF2934 domain-containing protein [Methylotenera sp.]|nr:DUF2934 domain-containing protein [Methylotenera sp.]